MSRAARFVPLASLLCGLLMLGCARMAVRVDILNSAYWSSPQYVESVTLAKMTDAEQAIRDGRFAAQREVLKQDVRNALLAMSEANPRNKPEDVGVPLKFVDRLAKGFNTTIDKQFNVARDHFRAAFDKVHAAVHASSDTDREAKMREAKALFTKGADTLAVLVNDLSAGVLAALTSGEIRADPKATPGGAPPAAALRTAENLKQQAQEITEGLIGNAGILDDPRAAAVVYAPNQYWAGQFNQTLCYGSLGNTDCAVKMEGLGAFTLKGVRLDATKITQATFSVAREAIQTVAAVYGVPIPKGRPAATASGQGSDASVSTDVDSPVKRQRDAGTTLLQLRLARLAMFETIVAQRQQIRGVDTARAQAIKTIKAVLDANRKQLDPGSP